MSDYESLREDARRDRADSETWCRSRDPYCANYPAPFGSYEAYIGSLCGACEQAQIDEEWDDGRD